ncbi:MAG: replicative DNA helicase [Actinomycetes bacterium]|nr:replicative DNA helicase [Actinomycetes bacterium]
MPDITQNNVGRIPPHDLEAERAVLGSMLLSAEAQTIAIGILTPQDFYRRAHEHIFQAMRDLFEQNVRFDYITLADRLKSNKRLDDIGGSEYLIKLSDNVPTSAFIERYANIVKKLSTYRKMTDAGAFIYSKGFEAPDDIDTAIAEAEGRLFEVTEEEVSNDFKPLAPDALDGAYHLLEAYNEAAGGIVGVPTGFGELDLLTGGFRGGQLIVLGARPSVGKTALALNIAVGAAKSGATVGVFSLEMTAEDLALRVLTSEAGISSQIAKQGNVSGAQWEVFQNTSDQLSKLDIWIDDTPGLDINRLRVKARRRFRKTNDKQRLLIVDYLQLMTATPRAGRQSENRQQEVAEISRGLKILAKDLDVPVLALSQLSRAAEQRKDAQPQLADLRESGAIEQDADIVMFLWRPDMKPNSENYEENAQKYSPDYAKLIVAKHRNGETKGIHLSFNKRIAKFIQARRPE